MISEGVVLPVALQGTPGRFCGIVALERRIEWLEAELAKRDRWASSVATSGHGWRL